MKEGQENTEEKKPYVLSLADLDNPDFIDPNDKDKKKDESLLEEETEEEKESRIKSEEEAKLSEDKKKKEKEEETKKKEEPKGKKVEEPKGDGEEEQEEEGDDALAYWEDVEKLTGEKLEVDFGSIDPISPEGVAIYNRAFREKGIEEFESQLEKKYPREYKALQIAVEGGDPSLIYKSVEEIDYKKITLEATNLAQQRQVLDQSLKAKGVDEESRRDLIKIAEDTGKLLDRSTNALKELKDNQELAEQQIQEDHNKRVQQKEQLARELMGTLQEKINSGAIGNFAIPEADKKTFYNTVLSNIREIDGQFYFMKPVSEKDLDSELQAEFFKMKKGDLKELVKRRVGTEITRRLKRTIEKSTNKSLKGDDNSSSNKFVPLSEM